MKSQEEAHKKVCFARWHMLKWSKDAIDEMNTLPVPEKYVACERFSPFCINGYSFGETCRDHGFINAMLGSFPILLLKMVYIFTYS